MDIATIIVLVALLLMVLAYVGQPFLLGNDRAERSPDEARAGGAKRKRIPPAANLRGRPG